MLDEAKREFESKIEADSSISEIYEKIENQEKLTYVEANTFAVRAGEILAEVFKLTCTVELCVGGKFPEQLAEQVIRPMLVNNYELVTDITSYAQTSLNKAAGIGIKAIKPDMNADRVNYLVDKVTSDEFEKTAWVLDEPVVNYTHSVVNDAIKANVEFHAKSGLEPVITRTVAGNCCDWCAKLAGTYKYGTEPRDIYRRHNYCRCTVIFSPRKGVYQGVHSKKTYTSEHSAEIAERINHIANDKKNVAKEKARKRLEKMAHAPENKNEEWAKEIRRREHIADYYANKNKSKK